MSRREREHKPLRPLTTEEIIRLQQLMREDLGPDPEPRSPRGWEGAKAGAASTAKAMFWMFIAPPVALIIVGLVVGVMS